MQTVLNKISKRTRQIILMICFSLSFVSLSQSAPSSGGGIAVNDLTLVNAQVSSRVNWQLHGDIEFLIDMILQNDNIIGIDSDISNLIECIQLALDVDKAKADYDGALAVWSACKVQSPDDLGACVNEARAATDALNAYFALLNEYNSKCK